MRVLNLASGSKGNCTFIKSEDTTVLVDAGISFSRIEESLKMVGENIYDLKAVFITHEHFDHIKGLLSLIKKVPAIEVFTSEQTASELVNNYFIPLANIRPILFNTFYFKNLTISAFSLPHDSSSCLGYSFFEDGDNKFTIATDFGCASESIENAICDSRLLFIESNHDIEMLRFNRRYPIYLKKRIGGDRGHLSNTACSELANKVVEKRKKTIVLAHLSENTNLVEIARSETLNKMLREGKVEGVDFQLDVLYQNKCGKYYHIK